MRRGIYRMAGLIAALSAFGAAAAPATAIKHHFKGPTQVEATDNGGRTDAELTVIADDGRNDVAIGFEAKAGVYVVSDTAGVKSQTCDKVSKQTVRCPIPESDPGSVFISATLGGGGDSLAIDDDVVYSSSALRGGIGHNMIVGGHSDDTIHSAPNSKSSTIVGGAGDDLLIGTYRNGDILAGGPGDDFLTGRDGPDSYAGGPGDDKLDANNGDMDDRINCGPGKDRAFVDEIDPNLRGCEDKKVNSPVHG